MRTKAYGGNVGAVRAKGNRGNATLVEALAVRKQLAGLGVPHAHVGVLAHLARGHDAPPWMDRHPATGKRQRQKERGVGGGVIKGNDVRATGRSKSSEAYEMMSSVCPPEKNPCFWVWGLYTMPSAAMWYVCRTDGKHGARVNKDTMIEGEHRH